MERIRCPHCGAVNQDATPQDPCWQCGKPLGAPPDEGASPPQKEAPVKLTLEERVALRKAHKQRSSAVPALFLIVVLLVIALIVLFLIHPWR